jgi:pSer/pThr/pTyr-binding forkhead associated (FHA) protein
MGPKEQGRSSSGKHTLGSTWDAPQSRNVENAAQKIPGLVLVFSNGQPTRRLFPVGRGSLTLGRGELADGATLDSAISREHARFAFDGRTWKVTDLESRNGTSFNNVLLRGETELMSKSLVRIGGALLLLVSDLVPFRQFKVGLFDPIVAGPSLCAEFESIALTSREGMVTSLLVTGETGTGKEIAARAFHEAAPKPVGPFVALNCATIPKELAERLLFGSRRGAFSGATDSQGYVQAADGGTLFLDEVAELPSDVQSKLLRMLETREVLRLGATAYEQVNVRICAATFRDLREEVGAGRFREDLFFRIAQAQVRLPPLRERIDEVPWHIQQVIDECRRDKVLGMSAGYVVACAARSWPGNVRELRAEVRRGAAGALARGADTLSSDDLAPTAGKPIPRSQPPQAAPSYPSDDVAAALFEAEGNVVLAARNLGVHRNKVRRWLDRYQVDAAEFKRRNTPS